MRAQPAILAAGLLLIASAHAASPPIDTSSASHQMCDAQGRLHSLSYSGSMVASSKFVDLDGDLGSKLSSVACDIDHTRLTLSFKHRADAVEWFLKFHDFHDYFIVGGKQWNCSSKVNRPTYILRRVVAASEGSHLSRDLTITTSMARYDEVFESADISYGVGAAGTCSSASSATANAVSSSPASASASAVALDLAPRGRKSGGEVGYDKHVCFGYNTNAGCSGAKAPIPLYSNAKVTTTCSDCYAALDADVFVNITIKGWKLESLAAGFTNVNLNSSAVFDAKASAQWSVGIDKTLKLVATDYLLDFKIGPVPFMLFFDVPLEVKGDLTFNTAAEVTLGVTSGIALGSTYVSWDPTRHWQHTKPEFVPSLTPQLATSASLDATADIQLMPSFNVHFDRIFSYSLTANPSLHAEITGSKASGKICMTSTYAMDLAASASLDINIPIVNFHKDWQWNDPIGTWSGVPVPEKCINLKR